MTEPAADDGGGASGNRLPEETPQEVRKHLAAAEAALMLVESLMLALVENRVLGVQQVIEAVETVIETKRQFVAEGSHPGISAVAAGMVTTIANSLSAMAEAGVSAGAEAGVSAGAEAGVSAGAEAGVSAGAEAGVSAGAEADVSAGDAAYRDRAGPQG